MGLTSILLWKKNKNKRKIAGKKTFYTTANDGAWFGKPLLSVDVWQCQGHAACDSNGEM